MSFIDEMNRIRQANSNKPIVTNNRETLRMFEEKSKQYIDEICNQIRSAIKSAAQRSDIRADSNNRSFFQKGKPLNQHYSTYLNSLIRLNLETSIFSYEVLQCCQPYGDPETRKGFVVNDAETIKYVLSQIESQLSKDGIYYVVHQNTSKYYATSGYVKTQRSALPIDDVITNIKKQIAARKKDCNAHLYDIFINWEFAYFI